MRYFWNGKHFWVWEMNKCEGGKAELLVKRAAELGLKGLLVKAWDGSRYWPQFNRVVGPAKNAGLTVAGWGYSYGNNVAGEIAAMEQAVAAGCDWLVIDAEKEYEGDDGKKKAVSLLTAVKSSSFKDVALGYTTFAFPSLHRKFPYEIFSSCCDVVLPQVYWRDFGMSPDQALQRSVRELQPYGLNIAPIGQAFGGVSPEEIWIFGREAEALGLLGISFWSWQHATDEVRQAVKVLSLPKDDSEVSGWAEKAWMKAIAKKAVDGTKPRGLVTREMLAVVLDNLGLLEPDVSAAEALRKLSEKAGLGPEHSAREQVNLSLLSVILEKLGLI
ncbi:MAG: hypothetical protein ACPLTR_04510 [Thermacetogeniaceae bacterium]